MALAMDPPWSSMGTGPLIFHGKPMEYFCKGRDRCGSRRPSGSKHGMDKLQVHSAYCYVKSTKNATESKPKV